SGVDLQPVNTAGAKLGDLVTDAHIPQVPQAVGRISGDDEDSRTRVGPGERDGRGDGSLPDPTCSSHEEQVFRSGDVSRPARYSSREGCMAAGMGRASRSS